MAEDNTQQSIIICSPQSYIAELNDHIEYAKKVAEENYTPYLPEQIESMVPDFIHRIEQEIQNENLHHPCLSIDLGQEYDVNGNMKHSNLKQVSVKFTPKAKHPYFISFLIEDKQGVKTATLQHILYGKQIQHLTKECTHHWVLLKEFVNRCATRNKIMERLHKRIIRESRIPTRTISSIAERFKEIVQHDPYPTTKKFSGYVILERNFNSEDEWFDWGYLFDTESQASTYLSNNLDSENDIENYDIVKVSFTLTKDFA